MSKKSPNRNLPHRRAGPAGRPPLKPARAFLDKPGGVVLLCLLLFGLTFWAFFPALQTDYQNFDERGELLLNSHMHSGLGWQNLRWACLSLEYSNWYPLTWLSHMLDFELFGPRPWGHHLTNVLLHAANGVLLFLVLKQMTGALGRSLIVAGLFALHPLRVESVAWISERKDVLCAFFGLLALMFYVRYAQGTVLSPQSSVHSRRAAIGNYMAALLFFAFGLMCKSMLVTFPCLLLLLDYWPLKRITNYELRITNLRPLLLEKIPFCLLVVPVSLIVYTAQKGGGQFLLRFSTGFRLETALMGYSRYLGKMFWPADLSVLYPYPDHWPAGGLLLSAALILGISALALVLGRSRPYLLVGWLWYLGSLVPVIGLIPLGAQSMSNRYTYLPMIGILLLVVWALADLAKRWHWRTVPITALATLAMGVCLSRTRVEIGYWQNGETLWTRAIAVTGNNFMAHYCLATVEAHTNPAKELAEYQKSVDLYPGYIKSQVELGVILAQFSRYPEAAAHFQVALQLDPQNGWAYHDLGVVFAKWAGSAMRSLPS